METIHRIAFGGGCHWCTEAVYNSLKGIISVEQGFVASEGEESSFSEAVIVRYDPINISLEDLILIHLYTHKSTSNHSMRKNIALPFILLKLWMMKGAPWHYKNFRRFLKVL